MSDYIVAARIDEHGNISGGSAGDQTGREVMKQKRTASGKWSKVYIPPRNGDIIAKLAVQAAANDNIGYDQKNRLTLYKLASANGFNLAKVGKCECDCSSLVAVCCIGAGFNDVKASMTTASEYVYLGKAGFKCVDYSASKIYPIGSIFWRKGHTGIYIGGLPEKSKYSVGTYETIVNGLNVRTGAGLDYATKPYKKLTADGKRHANALGQLLKGTRVTVKRVAADSAGNIWGEIPSGWICLEYKGKPYVKRG